MSNKTEMTAEELAELAGDNFTPDTNEEAESPADKPDDAGAGLDSAGEQEFDADDLAAVAGDDKPKTVPHKRFNEVNEEAKANRKRVLELEEQLARATGKASANEKTEPKQEAKAYDFDEAEERYTAAVLDGDQAGARQIRAEIRAKERAEADARADAAADKRYAQNKAKEDQARAETEKALAIAKAYEEFPFLNHEGVEPNNDAIEEVIALTNHYVSKGKTISEALTMATSKVGPRYAKAAEEEAPGKPKIDLQKQLERAGKIPAKLEGPGARSMKIDVSKLSRNDIKKLTPEQRAELEGQNV